MVRLILGIIVCSAVVIGSLGCSGQTIEGAWLGPLPFEDANSCRIKIYSDHRFDVACGTLDWAGAGHYSRDGNRLSLRFEQWVHKGQIQRTLPHLDLVFKGEGNTLRLGETTDERLQYVWRRQGL